MTRGADEPTASASTPRQVADEFGDVRLDWPAGDATGAPPDEGAEPDEHDDGVGFETHLLPAVPLLPAIAGRVDALDGQLRALGLRIDVLSNSVAAVRTAIGDRIDGYADTAAATARQAENALEEHRRSTERAVTEVRRALAGTEDVLRRLAARVDEVSTDVASLLAAAMAHRLDAVGDSTGSEAPETAVLDAVAGLDERLAGVAGRLGVLDGLDGLDARLRGLEERVAGLDERLGERLAGVAGRVAGADDRVVELDGHVAGLAARLGALDERLDGVAEHLAGLEDRVGGLAEHLGALGELHARLGGIEARLGAVDEGLTGLGSLLAGAASGSPADLERSLGEIRSLVEVVVDTMPASAEGSAADLAERVAELVVGRLDVGELARLVADRLEQRFEVVVEPGQ